MDTGTAWKKSHFILSNWSNFHITDNLSIVFHAFTSHMLTSLSVDEILLPRYENWSTNFRGLPLRVEMAPSCLKYKYSVLVFNWNHFFLKCPHSHHPSQTPCFPWITYASQKLMLDSCKMLKKQSEAFHMFLWHFFQVSSKVSSHPDCIFEIHRLWKSGFSRVYSYCCCSC